jgi:hypothetical protein
MKPDLAMLCAVAVLLAIGGAGCQSDRATGSARSSGYSASFLDAPPAGSVSDINRKLKGQSPAGTSTAPAAEGFGDIVLLVAHDAEGRPVYVETRRSSGDPALDKRAQDYVLKQRRFPRGSPNTVLITLKRGEVPKR